MWITPSIYTLHLGNGPQEGVSMGSEEGKCACKSYKREQKKQKGREDETKELH